MVRKHCGTEIIIKLWRGGLQNNFCEARQSIDLEISAHFLTGICNTKIFFLLFGLGQLKSHRSSCIRAVTVKVVWKCLHSPHWNSIALISIFCGSEALAALPSFPYLYSVGLATVP